jgi:hypothetical protein
VAHGITPERQDWLVDLPAEVWVTVTVEPNRWREGLRRALVPRLQTRGVARFIATLGAVAGFAGVAVGVRADSNPTVRQGGAADTGMLVDAAKYQLGCLGTTPSARAYLGADAVTSRTSRCRHDEVYLTAALRHVDRLWRLMLETRSDSCPSAPLLAAVRALLASCSKVPSQP